MIRCFVAIDVPDTLWGVISGIQDNISKMSGVKLVEKYQLHFTLKFLGELDNGQISIISKKLEDIAEHVEPFDLNIRGMGVFPDIDHMRVIWLGAPALFNLQKCVSDRLGYLFNEKDDNVQNVPHLTIARIHSGKDGDLLGRLVEENGSLKVGNMYVDRFLLKSSILTSHGPHYENVKIFMLRGVG